MTRLSLGIASALIVALALSCASVGSRLEPPEVTLVGLTPVAGGGFEQRFEIVIRISNPNSSPIEGEGLDVTLDLNGQRLARALSSEPFTIPRLGDDTVRLTGSTNLLTLFRQAVALPRSGRLDYELHGRVLLAGSTRWLSFSREGTLLPSADDR